VVSIPTPEAVSGSAYAMDGVLILVDALRASATVCCLLHQGAKHVTVVDDVQQARDIRTKRPNVVTCGERGGVKIAGFDLGNSPTEILKADLRGKSVVFTSSNFAYRLVAARQAEHLLVGTCINASACCREALALAENGASRIAIIPAGHTDAPLEEAEEDWAASSLLARMLIEAGAEPEELIAFKVAGYGNRIEREGLSGIFTNSRHGKALASLGYAEDVSWCAGVDVFSVVPHLSAASALPTLTRKQ